MWTTPKLVAVAPEYKPSTCYNYAEAKRFVDECERTGVRILGMDFLRQDERGITPMNSTAWPDDIAPDESWREARLLLQHGIPDGGNVVDFATDA